MHKGVEGLVLIQIQLKQTQLEQMKRNDTLQKKDCNKQCSENIYLGLDCLLQQKM